jgi:hypothetical protein
LQDFPKNQRGFFFCGGRPPHRVSAAQEILQSSGILFKKILSGITKGHDIATFSKARLAFYGVPPLIDL